MTPKAGQRPTVSVAMATYNGARFIRQQLDSIAAQSWLPDELVVSDDGSTDETLAIVRAFAETAPFVVRILDKAERLGFADNFIFAVDHCACDIVALCDQDDVWFADKIETGVGRLLADDSVLSLHQLSMTDETLCPIGLWTQDIVADRVWPALSLNPWSAWGNSMVFRRELAQLFPRLDRPQQPTERDQLISHDTWFYTLATGLGRVSHIARPLLLYRQHGSNVFGVVRPGLAGRLRIMLTVPVNSYRQRDVFFGHMAGLCETLASRKDGGMQEAAAAAATRYRQRQERARARTRLHTAPSLLARASAYRDLHGRSGVDAVSVKERALSAAKDLLLGVSGLGYHI